MHLKWKTVDCVVQKTFSSFSAYKLTLFRSTNNTDALKHLTVVLGQFLFDVFRFRKSLAFNTIHFAHFNKCFYSINGSKDYFIE